MAKANTGIDNVFYSKMTAERPDSYEVDLERSPSGQWVISRGGDADIYLPDDAAARTLAFSITKLLADIEK